MAIFDDFITLKEAGLISGYHPDYIGALIRTNKVKGKKIGKNWFVSKKEVHDYFATKHYVPAGKFISVQLRMLFFLIILVVFTGLGIYFFYSQKNASATPVVVQSSLSDVVGGQNDQGMSSDNRAQPVTTIAP